MQLSDSHLQGFIAACQAAFGRTLTIEEARIIATRYLFLLDELSRPLPEAGGSRLADDPAVLYRDLESPPTSSPPHA
jgi:hypothetical protein